MTPPPNAELMPSPVPIQQVNLVSADEAEPSLLFNPPDLAAKKRKGKGKAKAQSPWWFENLLPPCRNVHICFYLHIHKGSLSPKAVGPSRTHVIGDQPDHDLSPSFLAVE